MKKIIIGTRGSKLALKQAEEIKNKLEARSILCSLRIIKTKGDKILDVPLSKIGEKGLFVKEIENALIDKRIDIAVHSLKDLPSCIPEELCIAAIPERIEPGDVIISRNGKSFKDLSPESIIGTSSLRRKAQLLSKRSDLLFNEIRGNLDTRLKKLKKGEVDALILAAAGLIRMGWKDKITDYLSFDIMLPAPGQGCLALETRKDNKDIINILKTINHYPSYLSAIAERSFLSILEGGCQIPVGALASIQNSNIKLSGLIASLDGKKIFRGEMVGKISEGEEIGKRLANSLLSHGAGEILNEIRHYEK